MMPSLELTAASRVRLMVAAANPFNGAMDRIGRAMCEDPLERALSGDIPRFTKN